jgi:hypothetical protein
MDSLMISPAFGFFDVIGMPEMIVEFNFNTTGKYFFFHIWRQ